MENCQPPGTASTLESGTNTHNRPIRPRDSWTSSEHGALISIMQSGPWSGLKAFVLTTPCWTTRTHSVTRGPAAHALWGRLTL